MLDEGRKGSGCGENFVTPRTPSNTTEKPSRKTEFPAGRARNPPATGAPHAWHEPPSRRSCTPAPLHASSHLRAVRVRYLRGVSPPLLNSVKARRAAAHPDRPGASCKADPGVFAPQIDRARCEGKADCAEVCPYGVFTIRRMEDRDFESLGFFAKLKSRAHGRKTAYTPAADACQACGLCVVACPEEAIRLVRR